MKVILLLSPKLSFPRESFRDLKNFFDYNDTLKKVDIKNENINDLNLDEIEFNDCNLLN